MGAGIAQVSLAKGMHVILKDVNQQGVTTGIQNVERGLAQLVRKKKATSFERDAMLSNLTGQLDYSNFKHVDMVIEAVFEDINLKSKIVKEVEQVMKVLIIHGQCTCQNFPSDLLKYCTYYNSFLHIFAAYSRTLRLCI